MPHAVGFPSPTLHFSGVDPGIAANLPTSATGVVALVGPIVSALLGLGACVWMAWRGFASFAAALAVVAVSRFVVSVPYTIGNVAVRLLGNELAPPAFDEYVAGTALGWSGNGLLASSSLLLGLVLRRVGKHLPHGQRSMAWLALLLGTAMGWALWMLVLGPRLLP